MRLRNQNAGERLHGNGKIKMGERGVDRQGARDAGESGHAVDKKTAEL